MVSWLLSAVNLFRPLPIAEAAAAAGRRLGARYAAAGGIAKTGERNLLVITVIDTNTMRQIAGDFRLYDSTEDIRGKLPSMARNIVRMARKKPARYGYLSLAAPPVRTDSRADSSETGALAQILSICLARSGKYVLYPRRELLVTRWNGGSALLSDVSRTGERNTFYAAVILPKSGAELVSGAENYETLDDGVGAMKRLARRLSDVSIGAEDEDGGWWEIVGYGALNLVSGTGSFLQKDRNGALACLAGYVAGLGLVAWDLSLADDDVLAGYPGTVGLGVIGVTAAYGFIRPALYRNMTRRPGVIGERVTVGAMSGNGEGAALLLSYRWQF